MFLLNKVYKRRPKSRCVDEETDRITSLMAKKRRTKSIKQELADNTEKTSQNQGVIVVKLGLRDDQSHAITIKKDESKSDSQ